MSGLRTAGVIVLMVVLMLVLSILTVGVTADRTVMSSEFASDSAAEAGLYEALTDEILEELEEDIDEPPDDWPLDRTPEDMLRDVISEDHIRDQVDPNIDALYAYLQGDADELVLEVNATPTVDALIAELESDLREVGLTAFDVPEIERMASMAEDEETFNAEREAFKQEQLDRIQNETDEELDEDELEEAYEEEIDEISATVKADLEGQIDDALGDDEFADQLRPPITDLVDAYVDAQVGDIGFKTYADRYETAESDAIDAIVEHVDSETREDLPDTIDLTDEFDDDTEATFDDIRDVISLFGTILIGLLLTTVVLAGLIVFIAPAGTAAISIGLAATLAGLINFAGAAVAEDQAMNAIEDADLPSFAADLAVTLVEGLFGTWGEYSTILIVIGVVIAGIGIVHRLGMLPDELGSFGSDD